MDGFLITWRELLLAVVLAALVYLLEVLVFSRHRRLNAPDSKTLAILQADLDTLRERMARLEDRPPTESALDTQTTTYAEALRMAREGLPAPELAGRLGISRSEADLIVALNQTRPG